MVLPCLQSLPIGRVQEALRAVPEAELLLYGSCVDLRSGRRAVPKNVLGSLYATSGPHDRYRRGMSEAVGCVLPAIQANGAEALLRYPCLLYTSPSPRD